MVEGVLTGLSAGVSAVVDPDDAGVGVAVAGLTSDAAAGAGRAGATGSV